MLQQMWGNQINGRKQKKKKKCQKLSKRKKLIIENINDRREKKID